MSCILMFIFFNKPNPEPSYINMYLQDNQSKNGLKAGLKDLPKWLNSKSLRI